MDEAEEVWEALGPSGFLHALREAHETASKIVVSRLSRSAGFKERSFGYTSFDVLESQLDRIFGLGSHAAAGDDPLAGRVVRDNLNGSPGWRHGRYRVVLKRHALGAVHAIRWAESSRTKQAVARQEYAGDPQLAFDLGPPVSQPASELPESEPPESEPPAWPEAAAGGPGAEVVTLVLAHAASDEPFELELFLGRPRYNPDGQNPWWWLRPLDPAGLGPDPRRVPSPKPLPLWADGGDAEGDVDLRLRRADARPGQDEPGRAGR